MNAATTRWATHLSEARPLPATALTDAEAARVQRHRDRLLAALQARDRDALRGAKQAVLQAAYRAGGRPALRQALRQLSWHMAGWLLTEHR
ncbi:hypothetical protein [Paenacidovorax monticola]|uniref:Uncharacterized protein n=1 Tax=Paenacidovorax monticola TaxID=1926868 RepID=A0A7H0HCP4_9BURK|nr:hypothetical protein [Paenacidovorax monticola]QNP58310.1 hypothetical protein H9L24_14790 [Paenacidovorax monticola]